MPSNCRWKKKTRSPHRPRSSFALTHAHAQDRDEVAPGHAVHCGGYEPFRKSRLVHPNHAAVSAPTPRTVLTSGASEILGGVFTDSVAFSHISAGNLWGWLDVRIRPQSTSATVRRVPFRTPDRHLLTSESWNVEGKADIPSAPAVSAPRERLARELLLPQSPSTQRGNYRRGREHH